MQTKIMIKSFLVNLFLTILKLLGSVFSHSLVLMGDGIHCLSDMTTDVVGLIGSKIANKKPNTRHPYGYGKVEYITSTIVSIFIIFLGLGILFNGINSTLQNSNAYALIIVLLSIIIKFILSEYLLRKGKELNSNILITNGTESRYDAYCSILALLFVLISLLGNINKIFLYADLIGGIIISIITIRTGLKLFFENINCLLDEIEINEEKFIKIKELIEKHKTISHINDIKLIKYGSYYNVKIDVEMNGKISLNEIYITKSKIREDLIKNNLNIKYLTIDTYPEIEKHVTE